MIDEFANMVVLPYKLTNNHHILIKLFVRLFFLVPIVLIMTFFGSIYIITILLEDILSDETGV